MKAKIVAVEDEQYIRLYYHEMLSDQYDLVTKATAEEALTYMTDNRDMIDLVLLDYKLPDMSGVESLKKIKALLPSIPVIIVTAYGSEEVAVNAFRNGAIDYVKKPFNVNSLSRMIKLYVELPARDRENRRPVNVSDELDLMGTSSPADEAGHNYYKIQKAIKYIDANYMTKISLSSAANKACISKYHFSRVFKRVTSKTFQDYLNLIRIGKSRELLSSTTLKITEIAFAVGYEDFTHFGRTFKRIVGHAPSHYRKSNVKTTTRHVIQ